MTWVPSNDNVEPDPFCPRLLDAVAIMIKYARENPNMPTSEARENIKKIIARDVYPETAK